MSYFLEAMDTKGKSPGSPATRSRKRKADVAIFLQDWGETGQPEPIEMSRKRLCEHRVMGKELLYKCLYKSMPTPEKEDQLVATMFPPCYPLKFKSTTFSPLPQLSWANQEDVWRNMLQKDKLYPRDQNMFRKHPELQPSMRGVLLDWLMEVSEVHKLHRETFYLAQDLFDRFVATQVDLRKNSLQLIGIVCLFIAAKMEEIYPPKLHKFAYITDGACSEEEIVCMELIIMKELKWHLTPMTLVAWLNVYLQVAYIKDLQHFLLPQCPQQIYIKIVELLDLCILDVGCLEFPYSVLAASALYHFSDADLVERVSGFAWTELVSCVKYMVPFAMAVKESRKPIYLKFFHGVDMEDLHNIQTQTGCLQLLAQALINKALLDEQKRVSPVPNSVLTPPPSDRKFQSPNSD